MNIALASDHAGFHLKENIKQYLINEGYEIADCGTYSEESCDYPDFADAAVKNILKGKSDRGIFVCGTGIGISIAANRYNGIRAALCSDIYSARMSRFHNNSNVLAMGANIVGLPLAKEIIKEWLSAEFEGGRHERRICKLDADKIV